jgi:hypothetical protein
MTVNHLADPTFQKEGTMNDEIRERNKRIIAERPPEQQENLDTIRAERKARQRRMERGSRSASPGNWDMHWGVWSDDDE